MLPLLWRSAVSQQPYGTFSLSRDDATPALLLVSRTEGSLADGTRLVVMGVRNDSASLLEVLRVQPSCSCLDLSMEPLRIKPGGLGEIRAVTSRQSEPSGSVSVIYLRDGGSPESVEFSLVSAAAKSASPRLTNTPD